MSNYSTIEKVLNHPNVLQKVFQDVISTQNILIWWLHGKPLDAGAGLKKPTGKRFLQEVDGGSYIEVPLMLQLNTNLKSYEKSASFDLTANDIGDRAQYSIKSRSPLTRFRHSRAVPTSRR